MHYALSPGSVTEVLFVCVHNAGRSQMAAGLLKQLAPGRVEVRSAGSEPADRLNPNVVKAMDEIGIDINDQQSKSLDRFIGQKWDFVIPVCEEGAAACPMIPGEHVIERWQFDDLAAAGGTDEERLAVFRRVRDEIADKVRDFLVRHP